MSSNLALQGAIEMKISRRKIEIMRTLMILEMILEENMIGMTASLKQNPISQEGNRGIETLRQ